MGNYGRMWGTVELRGIGGAVSALPLIAPWGVDHHTLCNSCAFPLILPASILRPGSREEGDRKILMGMLIGAV